MNFFGKDIEVTNHEGEFYVRMDGVLNDEIVRSYSTSKGILLDTLLPLMATLKNTGLDGVYRRELVNYIVLDRTFNVGDMSIPLITDIELGRRFRLSTFREAGKIWVCAVQLEQAAHGIYYDLRVATNLKPTLKNSIVTPFRPRLVWQNDHEMMVYFVPLELADRYFKLLRTDVTSIYVDKHVGQIEPAVKAVWDEQVRLKLV